MSLKKASRTKSLSLSDDFPLKPSRPKHSLAATKKSEDTVKIMKYIDDNVIGKGVAFLGPFGRRKVVYAEYSSSGRSIQFLEDYINKEVLPAYGDINCISAVTGLQSQLYDNEARDLVRSAVNATQDDEIVFCDNPPERLCYLLSNSTINSNNISCNINLNSNELCDTSINCQHNVPILFVSTSEPIVNLKTWIDAGYQIERISKNHEGFLDLVDLEKKLSQFADSRRRLVGLFSGASRLTGILADDVATTILLHQYGALSIWDYSMAASCAPISTNPLLPGASKDAIFFHCSKLIGGVQAPGVLVIKKALAESNGSFMHDSVGVVNAVRAGLVLQLKESLGTQAIMSRLEKICKQMLSHIRTIPEIVLLGPACTTAKRLTTLCLMVRHPRGAFLHHRFVVAVLNDVFGIQATSDTLINDSMGICPKLAVEYEKVLDDDELHSESIRPGYIRITFPFFMSESEVGFILEALKMVATEAWKLLPQYEVDHKTGEWRHHSNSLAKERKWLGAIRYTDGKMLFSDRRISGPGAFPQNHSDCLQTARNIFNRARKMAQRSISEQTILKLPQQMVENLRWYMLPGEAHELLLGHSHSVKNTVPFDPHQVNENPSLLMIHRHHSLSALDIKRFKSRSLPASPIQVAVRRQYSSPNHSKSPTPTYPDSASPPVVRFSLGGEVTCAPNFSPPQIANIIASEGTPSRHSSCSDCAEDIQAYVKEVTKELATEIKSEIREVISKVEDVLEGNDSLDMSAVNLSSLTNCSSIEDPKRDSISANDIVDYLKEFSKEMMNEVTSEIRDAVSAVDEMISPEMYLGSRKNSPPDIMEKRNQQQLLGSNKILTKQRYSDITPDNRPRSADADKQRSESFPRPNSTSSWHQNTAPSPENSTPNCPYTGAISKYIDMKSTSSQDSGINLCFHETEEKARCHAKQLQSDRIRSISARTESEILEECRNIQAARRGVSESGTKAEKIIKLPPSLESEAAVKTALTRQTNIIKCAPSLDTDADPDAVKWHNLPKDVWKQAAEVND